MLKISRPNQEVLPNKKEKENKIWCDRLQKNSLPNNEVGMKKSKIKEKEKEWGDRVPKKFLFNKLIITADNKR